MTEPVVIELEGEPVAKGRPRFVSTGDKKIAFTPKKTRAYEAALGYMARLAMKGRPLLAGPLTMSVVASVAIPATWSTKKQRAAEIGDIVPVTKPDLDNYAKLACDSLNCIVYPDDKQIAFMTVSKVYSMHPGMRIEISTMKGDGKKTA